MGYEAPPAGPACTPEISETRGGNVGNAGDPRSESYWQAGPALSQRYLVAEIDAASNYRSRASQLYERGSGGAVVGPAGDATANPLGGALGSVPDAATEYRLTPGDSVAIDFLMSFEKAGTYNLVPVLGIRHGGQDRVLEGPAFRVSISITVRR